MHKVSLLNFEQINITPLKASDPNLLLYGVNYPETRPLQVYCHGTVAEAPYRNGKEYGDQLQFKFRPQIEDVNSFVQLESIFTKDPEAARLTPVLSLAGITLSEFTQRSVLDNTNYLKLKLKTNKDGSWRFYSDETLELEKLSEQMKQGVPLTVTLVGGFYFDMKNKYYGLYFTLQEILFAPGKPTDPVVKAFLDQNEQVRKTAKGKKTTIKVH